MVKQPAERAGTYDDEVARVVEQVPPGRALTYGDVAELIGYGSARSVGASMGRCGHELPWWRVVRHDGTLPQALTGDAAGHWDEEGAPLRPGLRALDLARARWDAAALLDAQDRAAQDRDAQDRDAEDRDAQDRDARDDDAPDAAGR